MNCKEAFGVIILTCLFSCGGDSENQSSEGNGLMEDTIDTSPLTNIEKFDTSIHAAHAMHVLQIFEHLTFIADFSEQYIVSGEPTPENPEGKLMACGIVSCNWSSNSLNHFDSNGELIKDDITLFFTKMNKFESLYNGSLSIDIRQFSRDKGLKIHFFMKFDKLKADFPQAFISSEMELSGAIEVVYDLSIEGEYLELASHDLSYTIGNKSYLFNQLYLEKNFNYPLATYTIEANAEIFAEHLDKTFTVKTPEGINGSIMYSPKTGYFEISGLYNTLRLTPLLEEDPFELSLSLFMDEPKEYQKINGKLVWTDVINLSLFSAFEEDGAVYQQDTRTTTPRIFVVDSLRSNRHVTLNNKRLGSSGYINVLWEGESFIQCYNYELTDLPSSIVGISDDPSDNNKYTFMVKKNGACYTVSPPLELPLDHFYRFDDSIIGLDDLNYVSR